MVKSKNSNQIGWIFADKIMYTLRAYESNRIEIHWIWIWIMYKVWTYVLTFACVRPADIFFFPIFFRCCCRCRCFSLLQSSSHCIWIVELFIHKYVVIAVDVVLIVVAILDAATTAVVVVIIDPPSLPCHFIITLSKQLLLGNFKMATIFLFFFFSLLSSRLAPFKHIDGYYAQSWVFCAVLTIACALDMPFSCTNKTNILIFRRCSLDFFRSFRSVVRSLVCFVRLPSTSWFLSLDLYRRVYLPE